MGVIDANLSKRVWTPSTAPGSTTDLWNASQWNPFRTIHTIPGSHQSNLQSWVYAPFEKRWPGKKGHRLSRVIFSRLLYEKIDDPCSRAKNW